VLENQKNIISKKKYRPKILDVVVICVLLVFVLYLAQKITTGIYYKWNWAVIPQYLFRYDSSRGAWVSNLLMQGFYTTIRLSVWATILAVIAGTIMGLFSVSSSLFKRLVARTYVELIRNTPPLVLIFIFYFFIGQQITAALRIDEFVFSCSVDVQKIIGFFLASPGQISVFLSALITLVLYEGAYITEIVRAGIQSIEKGHWESSASLGLSRWQQMRFVILPQAFRRTLPALGGQLISTIKDSAIVSVISIQDLTFQGMELMSATYLTFEVWITITGMYFVLTFICSIVIRRLELYFQSKRSVYHSA